MREEELKEHMKTCSGRKDLMRYKVTINRNPISNLPEPVDSIVYNTTEPSKEKKTETGITLQDESECWDDCAYKPYDPLANCLAKLQSGNGFIMPQANTFAGQMQAAAGLKGDPVPYGSLTGKVEEPERAPSRNCESPPHEDRKYDGIASGGSNSHRAEAKNEPVDYDSETAGYGSSSKQRRERDVEESSSSKRYKYHGESRHRIKPEESSYRKREDRSRSDSTSSSDRKSHMYSEYFDGHVYYGSYEASHNRHRRERYDVDGNSSHRRRHDRQSDSDSSSRSSKTSKHQFEPYKRYM